MDPLLDNQAKPPDIGMSEEDRIRKHFESIRDQLEQDDSAFVDVRNYKEDEEATCIEMAVLLNKESFCHYILLMILSVITLFIFPLKLYWSRRMQADWLYKRGERIDSSSHLLIIGRGKYRRHFIHVDNNHEIVPLQNLNSKVIPLLATDPDPTATKLVAEFGETPLLMFEYRFIKFRWSYEKRVFAPIKFECELPFDTLRDQYTSPDSCYSASLRMFYRVLYGECQIAVPKKSIPRLMVDEILNPFYIFQVFAMLLWFWDGYRLYASCILLISTLSVVASLYETIQNNTSIRQMALYNCEI